MATKNVSLAVQVQQLKAELAIVKAELAEAQKPVVQKPVVQKPVPDGTALSWHAAKERASQLANEKGYVHHIERVSGGYEVIDHVTWKTRRENERFVRPTAQEG